MLWVLMKRMDGTVQNMQLNLTCIKYCTFRLKYYRNIVIILEAICCL